MDRQYPHLFRLTCSALFALAAAAPARADSLDARLRALLGADLVKGMSISIDVAEITPKGPLDLFAYNATTPLAPASNCKLLTTGAAFEKYGPNATFKTTLYRAGDDLLLVGGGDPALGDAKLAPEQRLTAPFEQFANALKHAGISHFRNLIIDDRVFDDHWIHPNWPTDQRLDWYEAGIDGLNFNCNCLDWLPTLSKSGVGINIFPDNSYVHITNKASPGSSTRISLLRPATSNDFQLRGTVASNPPAGADPYSVPIYDPGLWTGTVLRDVLLDAGITSTGDVRRISNDQKIPAAQLLAVHETPILAAITRANTNSINMMAECICKRLGHDATGEPGSWENGTAAVEAYVTGLGAHADWVHLDDGSGLSSKNRVAAKAFTTVLAHLAARPDGELFVNTLATPGDDGTLRTRFKAMPVAGAIHAKTGHISGVSTLSGYIDTNTGEKRRFVFSILVNKHQGNVNSWQDEVCQAIYAWANGK
ncbi:MAG TPA: D-alanyl-D-alanine carboxypeptidase/D-alanyl-D-alanine-endopeptidase [Phycisphaerae bacterium]|nr:D-alanyl-D-alanine carboxypeptidase/D-alanyl-D-alanine-endopeptidase [Phycisphaerae bacterium]